jgi:hypothetical protein
MNAAKCICGCLNAVDGADLYGATECAQRLVAVEQFDVLGLGNRKPAYSPGEMDEVGFARRGQRVHATLFGQVIALPRIARAASSDHVTPLVVATPGKWGQVIPGEALPMPQITLSPMAILASVTIASKEECVGDLAAEAAGNVDELDEAYDRRFR